MDEVGQKIRHRWARPWMVPLLLAMATSGWMLAVEGRQGLARDESQYFRAGERYWGWFEALGEAPVSVDEIVDETELPVNEAMHHLTKLELKGVIARLPGKSYVRKNL